MKWFILFFLSAALNCSATVNTVSEPEDARGSHSPVHDGYLTAVPSDQSLFGDRRVAMGTKDIQLANISLHASSDHDLKITGMTYRLLTFSWKPEAPTYSAPNTLLNLRLRIGLKDYTGYLNVTAGPGTGVFNNTLTNITDTAGNFPCVPLGQTEKIDVRADVNTWPNLTPFYDGEWRIRTQVFITGFTYRQPGSTKDIILPVENAGSNNYGIYRSILEVNDTKPSAIQGGLSTVVFGKDIAVMAQTFTASPQGDITLHGLLSEWYLEKVRQTGNALPYWVYLVNPSPLTGVSLVSSGDTDVVPTGTSGTFRNILSAKLAEMGRSPAEGIKIPAGTSRILITVFDTTAAFSREANTPATLGAKLLGWSWSDGTLGSPVPVLSFPEQFDLPLSYHIIMQ